MLEHIRRIALLSAALALVGCGSGYPEPFPSRSAASSSSSTEQVSQASSPPLESTPQVRSTDMPIADPSTAGSLDETSLPKEWLGFIPAVVEPQEGEFNPNGTWVHGQDSNLISGEALPRCGTTGELPGPTAALTGSYRDPSNAPGNGIALEFGSAQEAHSWFEGYVRAMDLCQSAPAGFEVIDIAVENGTTMLALRNYQGMNWAERVWVEANVVSLLIVQGNFTLAQAAELPS